MLKLKKIKINKDNNTVEADYSFPSTDDIGHIIVDLKSEEIVSYSNNNEVEPNLSMAVNFLLEYVSSNETFTERTYTWY